MLWFLLIKSFGLLFLFLKSFPVGFNFSIGTHVPAKHSVSFIFLFIMKTDFLCMSLQIWQLWAEETCWLPSILFRLRLCYFFHGFFLKWVESKFRCLMIYGWDRHLRVFLQNSLYYCHWPWDDGIINLLFSWLILSSLWLKLNSNPFMEVVMATLAKRKRTKASIMVFSSISKRSEHLR